MKSPKEFDYDLWIAEDGQYMVRVKATREECAVSQAVFRKLRAEEKKLRREMAGAPTWNVGVDGRTIRAAIMSTDFVNVPDDAGSDPSWLIDPHDFEQDLLLRESIRELREQLTERQLEAFERCILGEMSTYALAKEKQVDHKAIWKSLDLIRKKFQKILVGGSLNAN